jgi:hypothetical protein
MKAKSNEEMVIVYVYRQTATEDPNYYYQSNRGNSPAYRIDTEAVIFTYPDYKTYGKYTIPGERPPMSANADQPYKNPNLIIRNTIESWATGKYIDD